MPLSTYKTQSGKQQLKQEFKNDIDKTPLVESDAYTSFTIGQRPVLIFPKAPGHELIDYQELFQNRNDVSYSARIKAINLLCADIKSRIHDKGLIHGDLKPSNIFFH